MIEERTTQPTRDLSKSEKWFVGWHVIFATAALSIGIQYGPMQALEHAGVDLYPKLGFLASSYYQGLTLHGVLNALIWTTFFITGFLTLTVIKGLGRPLKYPWLNKIGFWMMVVGLVTAAIPILSDKATVLYTKRAACSTSDWCLWSSAVGSKATACTSRSTRGGKRTRALARRS